MATYLRHPLSLQHETGQHPENAGRIRAIEAEMEARNWLGLEVVEAPAATQEQLERIHPAEQIARIRRIAESGGGEMDPDTPVSARSYDAALRAAGASVAGVERALGGEHFVFCGLRPPGHHAEPSRSMGFCLFGNIAVGAAHALANGAGRVMVIDWDVHHGNGTQKAFYASPDVLVADIHQSPFYPGTGSAGETGTGPGEGTTLNFPVPGGSGPETFEQILSAEIIPAGQRFKPGLIMLAAGFDAHREDPIGGCELDEDSYARMSLEIRGFAEQIDVGVVACLEGGYSPGALARSVSATIGSFTR